MPTKIPKQIQLSPPLREVWSDCYSHHVSYLPVIAGEESTFIWRRGLVALSLHARRQRWRLAGLRGPFFIWNGRVGAWVDHERLTLVDQLSGSRVATWPCPQMQPVVSGDYVVGRSDDLLVCFNLEGGREVWRWRFDPGVMACTDTMVTEREIVFGTNDGVVRALGVDTGAEVWRVATSSFRACVVENAVVVANRDLTGYDARSGKKLWVVEECGAQGGLQAYGGSLHALDTVGVVSEVNAQRGVITRAVKISREMRTKLGRNEYFSPIAVSDSHYFVGTNLGAILALRRSGGILEWMHRGKGATTFHSTSSFAIHNGRLYGNDMHRVFCYEQIEPLDGRSVEKRVTTPSRTSAPAPRRRGTALSPKSKAVAPVKKGVVRPSSSRRKAG